MNNDRTRWLGLSHEQFPAPERVGLGIGAEQAGFDALWASDHFHPWQDNQGHSGQAWITLSGSLDRPEVLEAFREGARSSGKDPDRLRVLVESYVIVGGAD